MYRLSKPEDPGRCCRFFRRFHDKEKYDQTGNLLFQLHVHETELEEVESMLPILYGHCRSGQVCLEYWKIELNGIIFYFIDK